MKKINFILKAQKLFNDFFYNLLASIIFTGTTQLIIYPLLAKWLNILEYGTLITSIGIINILIGTIGISMNNTRLILNSKYNQKMYVGDFQLILVMLLPIPVILMFIIGFCYFKYSFFTNISCILLIIFSIFKQYYMVEYRLILNYKKIMCSNILAAIGLCIGIIFVKFNRNLWILPFLISEILSIIYVLKTTKIWREPLKRTYLFKSTLKQELIIMISLLFGHMLTYFDKLVLYPTVGAKAVSIYSVASFFGKSLAILMNPLASVLLGYFAQDVFSFTKRKYRIFSLIIISVSIIFMLISCLFSPIFTKMIYFSLYKESQKYIFIANTAAIITVSCNLLQTVVLKFSPSKFQIFKEIIYLFLYSILCLILIPKFELWGFCYAIFISNVIKFIVIFIMGDVTFKK